MITTQPFKLSLGDQGQFFWAWYRQNLFSRANLFRLAIASVVFFAASIMATAGFIAPKTFMGIIVVLNLMASVIISALIVYIFLPLIHWLLDLIIFIFRRSGHGECQVTLSEDGIVNRINDRESLVNWSQVRLIKTKGSAILLFTGKTSAIIVPKRALSTKEDADSFLSYAQTQIEPF